MNQVSAEYTQIMESGLFSADWYLDQYHDVAAAGQDPLEHYLAYGAKEGRDPGPEFSTTGYLSRYHDVADGDINPLLHYIRYGKSEGRLAKPCLDPQAIKRPYLNFGEYLSYSMLDPLVKAPFSIVDLDSFAFMNQVTHWLCLKQKECVETPLVTVIMPMRDRDGVVAAAVLSVLEQSYKNFELIVIDDGSMDNSVSVVSSFADSRILLLTNVKSLGVSAARNQGLAMANGKLIAYLDSDNTWRPDYLSAMVGAFQLRSDADAIYGGQYLYRGCDSEPFAVRFGSYNLSLLQNRNYIDLNCFIHRRDILTAIGGGFCEDLKRWVDWELILRIAQIGRICSVPILESNYFIDKVENTITVTEKVEPARNYIMDSFGYENKIKIQSCKDPLTKNVSKIILDPGDLESIDVYIKKLPPSDSDLLIIAPSTILQPDTLPLLQKTAYTSTSIAIVVPQLVLPSDDPTIHTHVPYAFNDVRCDIALSNHYKNIEEPSLFHDGETVDLKYTPFTCVYIKRDIWNLCSGCTAQLERDNRWDQIICNFIRHILKKRIVYSPEAFVLLDKPTTI